MPTNDAHNNPIEEPPVLAQWLLRRSISWFYRDEIDEDLRYLFRWRVQQYGLAYARRHYWKDVLSIYRRRGGHEELDYTKPGLDSMLLNYLKIALRTFKRQAGYTGINIVGLAIGLAACLFIGLYVRHELSFDRFHAHADQTYRIAMERIYPTNSVHWALIPPGVVWATAETFPEVKYATRVSKRSEVVRLGDQVFNEQWIIDVDSTFFNVFPTPVVAGDPHDALRQPNSVIITSSTARKYFGDTDPMGQTLTFALNSRAQERTVMAVVEDWPENSHIEFDWILPLHVGSRDNEWTGMFAFYSYIVLHEEASPEAVDTKLPGLARTRVGAQFESEEAFAQWVAAGNEYRFFLQPLTNIHLHSNYRQEFRANSDITYVYLFIAVGLFILLIACINFMNLATARSANRAREVGVRKVMGSMRMQLVAQFLVEAVLMVAVAFGLAMSVVALLLPAFSDLVEVPFSMALFSDRLFLWGAFVFIVGFGVLTGSYPAFFLSAFRPVAVLKGRLGSGARHGGVRNGLVVVQFALSVAMIVGTLVVFQQVDYLTNKKLGFEKDHVVMIRNVYRLTGSADAAQTMPAFKQELLRQANVTHVAFLSEVPGHMRWTSSYARVGYADNSVYNMGVMQGDTDVIDTFGMQVVNGRSFRTSDMADTTRYALLNETAARFLDWADDPVGKQLTSVGGQAYTVIGVVQDFHFESLHIPVRPLLFFVSPMPGVVAVRVQPGTLNESIAAIENTWKQFGPNVPFEYDFLDTSLQALYDAEERTGRLFTVFAGLAIFIACLGLLGLAAFSAEQRTKEIGIRKALGASMTSVLVLVSKDFLKLVGVAFVLAVPVAYFAMDAWLSDFAYRVNMGVGVFLLAGGLALAIAVLTIGSQSIKAARSNPAKALRHE